MAQFLNIERTGNVVVVRMSSPDTRNALSDPSQMQEFVDLCAELRDRKSVV